jgi:hypothetical protein
MISMPEQEASEFCPGPEEGYFRDLEATQRQIERAREAIRTSRNILAKWADIKEEQIANTTMIRTPTCTTDRPTGIMVTG